MSDNRAIVYKGPEDVYGPCGCGLDMALLPVLLPKMWFEDCYPTAAEEDAFCTGMDLRRIAGLSYSCIVEHEIDGTCYLANFSCCPNCADRAVELGYAVWSKRTDYPRELR